MISSLALTMSLYDPSSPYPRAEFGWLVYERRLSPMLGFGESVRWQDRIPTGISSMSAAAMNTPLVT